ncbi:hypothetical protein FRC12_003222 [Ceratobasidium sp. 428]|nr:hypothetical protein FRC12_003222 [Ceratobasidium sp. 428]
MNGIHSTREIKPLIEESSAVVKTCEEELSKIASLIPPNQFWRWKDMWTRHLTSILFVAALNEYLTTERLITLPECETLLQGILNHLDGLPTSDIHRYTSFPVQSGWKGRLQIASEDYLHAIIALVNELSRVAVNSVTLGDFDAPLRISIFVRDLYGGFSLLNLKNDSLRRRFDSLKYDMKKIEEVVYDVSLRKLAPASKPETKAMETE